MFNTTVKLNRFVIACDLNNKKKSINGNEICKTKSTFFIYLNKTFVCFGSCLSFCLTWYTIACQPLNAQCKQTKNHVNCY